jgi:hypothetical protein
MQQDVPMSSPWTRLRWLFALLALVLAAAACGDDDDDGGDAAGDEQTTQPDGDDSDDGDSDSADGDECGLYERIEELDDESQAIVNDTLGEALASQDPEEAAAAFEGFLDAFQPFAAEKLPDMVSAYDDLAAVLPDDLAEDVELVRDFTESTLQSLASAEDLADVQALFSSVEAEATAAGAATLRIDERSRDTCDISIAD